MTANSPPTPSELVERLRHAASLAPMNSASWLGLLLEEAADALTSEIGTVGKPVAWRWKLKGEPWDKWTYTETEPKATSSGWDLEPLYLTPSASGAVEALRECRAYFERELADDQTLIDGDFGKAYRLTVAALAAAESGVTK
jgi:hypothetical protein